MLEFDDIQHILLTRTPALTGQYEFVAFRDPAGGRAWVTALLDKLSPIAIVPSVQSAMGQTSITLIQPERRTF